MFFSVKVKSGQSDSIMGIEPDHLGRFCQDIGRGPLCEVHDSQSSHNANHAEEISVRRDSANPAAINLLLAPRWAVNQLPPQGKPDQLKSDAHGPDTIRDESQYQGKDSDQRGNL